MIYLDKGLKTAGVISDRCLIHVPDFQLKCPFCVSSCGKPLPCDLQSPNTLEL